MDDNARLRAAAADATAQRDRLEPALEECMDLLLQVQRDRLECFGDCANTEFGWCC
ncbi:hypothetical protein DIPPA_24121 [Diplonema papillatum]|nr:hypothetical protein DIPPA_24121 [Diplonema papillatum]